MLRKLILLAITTGLGKRLYNGYKAQQARAKARPAPPVNVSPKPATVPTRPASTE